MHYKKAREILNDARMFQNKNVKTAMEVAIIAISELEEYKKLGNLEDVKRAVMSREAVKDLLVEYANKDEMCKIFCD